MTAIKFADVKRSDFRTTVSMSKVVWLMAEQMMDTKGFNGNFSAYIADLIRRDQESHTTHPAAFNETAPIYTGKRRK